VAHLALVSFRLGGTDGVSIESAKWTAALTSLGHRVTTVAGEGEADVVLAGLAIGASGPASAESLHGAFAGAQLVIVGNLASLPLNVAARDVLYEVLDGRPAILHHHDLAWQRPHLAHLEGPRSQQGWHHVTINDLSRHELAERGIEAVTMMNTFDCDPPHGNRDATRRAVGVGATTLALFASRALARKNVEGALALCESLGAVLWILGPAEDGYGSTFERLVAQSRVEVRRGLPEGSSIHDAYAACDLVVMSSTWEGFGNPVLESVTHRRPLALHPYPVAREIAAHGFEFFGLDDVDAIAEFIRRPRVDVLTRNLEIARREFNLASLPRRLEGLLDSIGVR
jgi:glycosyltransferase involved in cell wall biosynthesis